MTNCKVGDRAIVVGGQRNLGRIVNIIEPLERGLMRTSQEGVVITTDFIINGPLWVVDDWMKAKTTGIAMEVYIDFLPDAVLRPLIDGDGEDETLSWKEVPTLETTL